MKRFKYIVCCLFVVILALSGCNKSEEELVEGTGVFYLNTEGTGLVKNAYSVKASETKEQVEELLLELQKETDCIDYVSVVPVGVELEKWKIQGDKIHLYFGVKYNEIAILYRAHYVSRALEEKIIGGKIPYTIYSGIEFYKRKEIKEGR